VGGVPHALDGGRQIIPDHARSQPRRCGDLEAPAPGERALRRRGARLRAQPLCGGSARSGSGRLAPAPLESVGPRRRLEGPAPPPGPLPRTPVGL